MYPTYKDRFVSANSVNPDEFDSLFVSIMKTDLCKFESLKPHF